MQLARRRADFSVADIGTYVRLTSFRIISESVQKKVASNISSGTGVIGTKRSVNSDRVMASQRALLLFASTPAAKVPGTFHVCSARVTGNRGAAIVAIAR